MAKVRVGDRAPAVRARRARAARTYRLADYCGHGRDPRLLPGRLHARLHQAVLLLPRRRRPDRGAGRRRCSGISPQSVESHERFTEQHGLKVPLLSDPDKARGARLRRGRPGRVHLRRSVFLVDGEGIVRYRHVALFGLRYQDVSDLERAVRGSCAERGRCAARGSSRAVRARRGRRRARRRGGGGGAARSSSSTASPRRGATCSTAPSALRQARLPADLLRRPRPRRLGAGARRAAAPTTYPELPPTSGG